jgi:hypothetical protein
MVTFDPAKRYLAAFTMLKGTLAIAFALCALSSALADAPDLKTAPEEIEQVTLEDPQDAESNCYLDLDTGGTQARGELLADLQESRRWIREHGIDLMCESREPANGFIAYDLRLLPATAGIDHPPDFATLTRMLDKVEAPAFDFVSPGEPLPKTYFYQTRDGAMGVLEVGAVNTKPSGLTLRYRRVVPAPRPKPPPIAQREFGTVSFPQLLLDREARLKSMRATYGDNHPLVKRAMLDVELYKQLNHIAANEDDHEMALLKMEQVSVQHALQGAREFYTDDSRQIQHLQEHVKYLDRKIQDLESRKHNSATKPSTQPVPVAPLTKPFAKDFHL